MTNIMRRLTVAVCITFAVYSGILCVVYYRIGERVTIERDACLEMVGK